MSTADTHNPSSGPPRRASLLHAVQWRMLVFLAWRNLWRARTRSLLTIGAIVVGLVMMIVTAALTEGMVRQYVGYATELQLGHVQMHRQGYKDDQELYAVLPLELRDYLVQRTGLRIAPRAYAAGLASAGNQSGGALLQGISPELEAATTRLSGHVSRGGFRLGRWEPPAGVTANEDRPPVYGIVVGHRFARRLQAELGDEVVLITQAADGSIGNGLFRIAGILKPLEPGFDRMGVLLSLEAFQSLMFLPGGGVHEFAVAVDDPAQNGAAKAALEEALAQWQGTLPDAESGPVLVRRWQEIIPAMADMLEMAGVSTAILMMIIFAIAALGMLNTVLMAIHERRREFGMLLAMGMGRVRVLVMVLLESFFLALVAALVGTVLGTAWALHLEAVGIDFSAWLPEGLDWAGITIEPIYKAYLLPEHIRLSVSLMLIIVMLAALIPAWRTVRYRAAEVMHP